MFKHKKKLIILLAIQAILTVIHKVLQTPAKDINNWYLEAGWHYWVGMAFGFYVMWYAISLTCKKCGAPQVWGWSNIYKFRWPAEKCWKCKENIE